MNNQTNYTSDLTEQTKVTVTNLNTVISKLKKLGRYEEMKKLEKYIRTGEFNKKVLLIGGPQISGSFSPLMHTLNSLNLDNNHKNFLYTLFIISDNDIDMVKTVGRILQEIEDNEDILGANITMPFKMEAYNIFKEQNKLDESARLVGAVNTISKEEGKLKGYNTDMEGVSSPIRTVLGDKIGSIEVGYVIGNGGAAMAAIGALLSMGITNIKILARTLNRKVIEHFTSDSVKQILAKTYNIDKPIKIEHIDYDVSKEGEDDISKIIKNKGILINTLPFGFKENLPNMSIKENKFNLIKNNLELVFDAVYDMNKGDTPLIKLAKESGILTCDGIDMVTGQAVKGFEFWTKGGEFDLEETKKLINSIKNKNE